MRMWARNTSRAALVAASAVALGVAFGSGATATADITAPGGAGGLGTSQVQLRDSGHGGGDGMQTAGNFSIAGGNQIVVPISIPVNVCGNSVAVLGLSQAKCKGGASVSGHGSHGRHHSGHRSSTGGWEHGGGYHGGGHHGGHGKSMKTAGNFSILGGNQVVAPISVPVDVCGNSVAVLGVSQAKCKGGASVGDGDRPHHHKPKHHKPKHKKHHKPSKHRPAAKNKKLPSTLRGTEGIAGS